MVSKIRGIDLAIHAAGNRNRLARAIGKSPQLIAYWDKTLGRIPAEYVPEVSRKTGIPAALLRPDIYEVSG